MGNICCHPEAAVRRSAGEGPYQVSEEAWKRPRTKHGDKYKWSAQLTVINLANRVALYNFLSTFSGTHYVTPRTVTAQIGFNF